MHSHKGQSPHHQSWYSVRLTQMALLFVSLSLLFMSLPVVGFSTRAFAASTAPMPHLQHAAFTLDGVTVNVATPFLPGPFDTSSPGDATQTAVAGTPGVNVHPYGAISLTAVPYGTRPKTEGVPLAQIGGAQTYRNSLYQYRVQEGDTPQVGPTASLFGQNVTGIASLMHGDAKVAYSSTVVVEWVVEAGKRLWIIRVTEEEPLGTTTLTSAASFLTSLNYLKLTSNTLSHATTIKTLGVGIKANTALANYPLASWWNGSCSNNPSDTGNIGTPSGTSSQASWHGIDACYDPTTVPDANITITVNGQNMGGVSEWECVELVMRYMLVAGFINHTYSANGVQVVANYPASNMDKINNGTVGRAPQAGDVLSYNNPNDANGHTALVTGSSVDGSGNGTITILQQNSYANGNPFPTDTLQVKNWQVINDWNATITSWLDPHSGGTGGGSSSINTQDVFVVGANGHLFDYRWSSAHWGINDLGAPATGVTLVGSPSSNTFTHNGQFYQHVLVMGSNNHLYEYWQVIGGSWNLNDLNALAAPPSGVTFVGSPNSFSYSDSSGAAHHSVFILGSDGHLYNYAWPVANGWSLTDLTSQVNGPSGVTLIGTPSGNTFTSSGQLFQHVLVNGNNGHLYEYWQVIGGSWNLNDLNALTAPPSGVTFVGSPNSFSYSDSSGAAHHSVSILGSNGDLYDYAWSLANGWSLTDLTSQVNGPSGVTLIGTPSGNAFTSSGQPFQHVLITGSNGHLYEYWQVIGNNWNLNDLNAQASTSITVASSPFSESYTLSGQTQTTHSIYVITSDGSLQEFNWSTGNPWQVINHGTPSGTTLTTNTPGAVAYSS